MLSRAWSESIRLLSTPRTATPISPRWWGQRVGARFTSVLITSDCFQRRAVNTLHYLHICSPPSSEAWSLIQVVCFRKDFFFVFSAFPMVLLSGSDSWHPPLWHKRAAATGVWPASLWLFQPPPPTGLARPTPLLCSPLIRSSLHMGLVSHGNLLSPIRCSRQLGLPSVLPSVLSGSAMPPPWSSPADSRSSIPPSELLSCP